MSRAGPALTKDLDRQFRERQLVLAPDHAFAAAAEARRAREQPRDTGFAAVAGASLYTSLYEPTTTFPALCAAILGQVVVGEGEVTGHPLPASVRNLVLGRVSTYA